MYRLFAEISLIKLIYKELSFAQIEPCRKKKTKSDFYYILSCTFGLIMIEELEFDIKKIQTNLKRLGFQFPSSVVENHNRMIAINYRLKEISTVLTGECDEILLNNVEMVTGTITATYSSVRTLKEAALSIKKTRKYIDEYLKI
tara:strand:+ start:373 stop:804 length:432 start_codon:yes stop_codon:yes gene_type:complete